MITFNMHKKYSISQSSPMHRVVVTGMGVVSPFGAGVEKFWKALLKGSTAWRPGPGDFEVKVAAVPDEGWDECLKGPSRRYADRAGQLAVVAARQAVAAAGWSLTPRPRRRTDSQISVEQERIQDDLGVIVGSSIGGVSSLWSEFSAAAIEGTAAMTPFILAKALINMIPASISIDLGVRGESLGIAGACAAGTMAIGEAYRRISRGQLRAAVAGGTDACLVPAVMAPFLSLGAMSPPGPKHGIRPFAEDRNGFLMGEGAAMLVLESAESAMARGATIFAELIGYYASTDAVSLFAPDEAGIRMAVRGLLDDAAIEAAEVTYVNAHATGTQANDSIESFVYSEEFPHGPYMSGIKANIGHTLGAAGAFEAVATITALRTRVVPHVPGLVKADMDPDISMIPVLGGPQSLRQSGVAVSSSFAFGGQNALLAIR